MAQQRIFRQEALDRLKSPDELDQMLTLVDRKSWLALSTVAALCLAGVIWSFVGRIPVSVNGIGVLINPGSVKSLQSSAAGQIVEVLVRVGQEVKKDETVIAVLNQPDLRKQLAQERKKLEGVLHDNELFESLDQERLALEQNFVKQQEDAIRPELEKTRVLAQGMGERNTEVLDQQTEALNTTRTRTDELNALLKKRAASMKTLSKEGLLAEDVVLNSQREAMDNELKVANLDVQLQELKLRRIEGDLAELQRQNRVAELEFKLLELEIRGKQAAQEIANNRARRESEQEELERSIEALEELLERQGRIVSPFDGRMLEVSCSSGQIVGAGDRLGAIEVDSPGASLKNLAYFQVSDGKRIKPGDKIFVTPTTVQRERYGSIVGSVGKVSSFPITQQAAANVVGNSEVAEALMQRGGAIEIEADLEADPDCPSGFKWTSSGPPFRFSAGTTTTVRVMIEERAPISYVLPIFRSWLYGETGEPKPKL